MGHQQTRFEKTNWKHYLSHGGSLRQKRQGRGQRPLSTKEPLHLVLKVRRERLRSRSLRTGKSHALILKIMRRYAKRFWVKVEQVSIQGDHCHLLIRAPRRAKYHDFFRVFAGQIAQQFEREGMLRPQPQTRVTDAPPLGWQRGTGLWRYRPFSRVVRGYRAYRIVRDYIQLNECEALGLIPYRKLRLRGLSSSEWEILWR
jgi:putative transposase